MMIRRKGTAEDLSLETAAITVERSKSLKTPCIKLSRNFGWSKLVGLLKKWFIQPYTVFAWYSFHGTER